MLNSAVAKEQHMTEQRVSVTITDAVADVRLTRPEKRNAIHGLLQWRAWQVRRQARTRVTMGTRLFHSR